ncbi:Rho GTPase activation protein [Kockiozyma suomiensis]|uniref:Rho GTPase activation protein n=1 Tax=Kockiozyma suomiensis TaxID=1337062 RepID=UPI00334314CB
MSAAVSRRRSGFIGRPQSMIVDVREFDIESSFRRQSSNRRGSSTASSVLSSIHSVSSAVDILAPAETRGSRSRASTSSSSTTAPSPADAAPKVALSAKHGLSPEKESKKTAFFGKMKLSLDRRRKMPWPSSSKNTRETAAPAAGAPTTPRKSGTTSKEDPSVSSLISSNHQRQKPKEQSKRYASALFTFSSGKSNQNSGSFSSPSSAPTIKVVPKTPESALAISPPTSSPGLSISSSMSLSSISSASPSPNKTALMSDHQLIPETIQEDEPESPTRQNSLSIASNSAVSSMPRLMPGPRPRKGPSRARPATIVGFFRQSRVFTAPKQCDVFGMSLADAAISTRMSVENNDSRYWVPAIVSVCVDYLNQYGVEEEGLYRVSGSALAIEELKKEFAFCGEATVLRPGVHDVHSVASLLKSYIRQLPEEIVPSTLQLNTILRGSADNIPFEEVQNYLAQLPAYNYHTIRLLCQHFSLVAANHKRNRMTLSNLMLILCPTMRMDSRLFSWMVEFPDQCVGDAARSLVRYGEQISLVEESCRQRLG